MIPIVFSEAENPMRLEKRSLETTPCDKLAENPLPLEIGEAFFFPQEEEYFSFEI